MEKTWTMKKTFSNFVKYIYICIVIDYSMFVLIVIIIMKSFVRPIIEKTFFFLKKIYVYTELILKYDFPATLRETVLFGTNSYK